jgi:hypothetical protein
LAEVLADVRHLNEERLHNNQPEWTRGTRGMQPEAMAQRDLEAPAVGRHWRDERQGNNHLDKRHKRGAMSGSSAMRGRGAGRWEAAV